MRLAPLALAALVPALPLSAHADDDLDDDVGVATSTEPPIAAQEGFHQGIGVESTLAGVAGLAYRQGLGPAVSLEVVVMAAKGAPAYIPGGAFGAATTYGLAARAIVPLRRGERGIIAAVGGFDLGVRTQAMTDTAVHPAFEAGLRGELFLASHLSVSLEVGGVLDLPPDAGRVLSPERASGRPEGSGTTVSFDNTALAAGAGLTFWLPAQDPDAPEEVDGTERPYVAVGASRALSEVAGPAALFRLTDGLDLDVILGLAKLSGTSGPTSALGLAVGVRQALARRGPVALSVGGRVGLAYQGARMTGTSRTVYLLEAPARIEYTATPWLRLHLEGGFALDLEPGGDAPVEGPAPEGQTTWSLGAAGLAAGAGFAIAVR